MFDFLSKVFSLKTLRILLAIFCVIALVLLILVAIPSKGSISSKLTGTDFNGDGDAMRVRATIINESNKPAFNVGYEIVVTDMEGNVIGTYTDDVGMMWPGAEKEVETFMYFDVGVDMGNVEINTSGYIIGG